MAKGGIQRNCVKHKYSIKLIVNPLYEGREHTESISNEAQVVLFYPELTFQDSTLYLGEALPLQKDYSNRNWLQSETRWKNTAGIDSTQVDMTSTIIPTVRLTYSLGDYEESTMPNYELPVNVTIEAVGYAQDVQNLCILHWKNCEPDCGKGILTHHGMEDSEEFWLHTLYTVALPETGSIGTIPYMFSGWAIILVAGLLMYSTYRNKRKGAR